MTMDLWCVHVKNTNARSNLLGYHGYSFREIAVGKQRAFLSLIPKKRYANSSSRGYDSLVVVRALAKKNNGGNNSKSDGNSSFPGNGDRSEPDSSDGNKSHETASQKPRHDQDWRSFRALLFSREQAENDDIETQSQDGLDKETKPLGTKWAHPIHVPESGCVLIATEKLDGVRTFERTVVLLLRSGTRHPQEGPFGVVINRPLNKKIKHMNPSNIDLATTFADCALHFGGPLEASMFLLKTEEKSKLPGLEEVIPGLCFGARNSLDEAAALVKKGLLKPQDFRFFMGYAGWQFDQLREEIESDYWYVTACSANLISSSSNASSGLWKEILQLMGGHYSELSRKPKQDL